ncbi:MAG: hypothetical protein Q9175_000510 [Cornicularia normoerica]
MFNEMDFYQLSLLDLEFLGVSMLCCTRIVSRTGAFDVLQSSPSPEYQEWYTEGSDDCVDRETPTNTDAMNYSLPLRQLKGFGHENGGGGSSVTDSREVTSE